jgi:thiamine-monophosphate kinase
MVAGVHFLPGEVAWRDVGWKALAVNVSDVAAMGAQPSFALVTLCVPPETAVADIDELYAGLRECAEAYGVTVAGGDVVASPVFAITVALSGAVGVRGDGTPALLRRDGACAGDAVAVTGALGGSAGGLRVLTEGVARTEPAERLIARHMRPRPRVDAGRAAVSAGAACAIDISDGLAQDLRHICEASSVGATVRVADIPISPHLLRTFPEDATAMAAGGGEDYELLFTGPASVVDRVRGRFATPITVIGSLVEDREHRVRFVDENGQEVSFATTGWDHFAGRAPH